MVDGISSQKICISSGSQPFVPSLAPLGGTLSQCCSLQFGDEKVNGSSFLQLRITCAMEKGCDVAKVEKSDDTLALKQTFSPVGPPKQSKYQNVIRCLKPL